jgi:hypothetical protein
MLVERFGAAGARRVIQRRASQRQDQGAGGTDAPGVQAAAEHGLSGGGGPMPHGDAIQRSFGRHDVSHVQAHTGGAAEEGARAMGAEAFATGDQVAFGGAPSLHTAAHEAAHVVQQQAGVQLKRDDGAEGGAMEQHADAVADKVVRGESAEALLDQVAPGGAKRGGGKPGGGTVQRKIKRDADVLDGKGIGEIMHLLQGDPSIDQTKAKEVALELLSTARVIPLQEAIQLIKERAKAGGAAGAEGGAGDEHAAAAPEAGSGAAAPGKKDAMPAPAQGGKPATGPLGNFQQTTGVGATKSVGQEPRDAALTPGDKERGKQGEAAKDLGPKLHEVQGILAEIRNIKGNVPWGTSRIRVHRAIQAFDGLLNVAVGAVAVAGDFASMGMASPIMGGVVLAKDAAIGAANEHLAGGGVSGSVTGASSAQATASNVAIPQVKAMIGPVTAGGVNMVPLAGGAAMAGKGVKQIYSAAIGELPPGAAGDQVVFEDIKTCRSAANGALSELKEKQAVLHDPGLAEVIAEIVEFIEWLNRQEAKSRKRFVKRAPGPVGRARAGAGESKEMMSAQHSQIMPFAALQQAGGEAGKWSRFKAAMPGGSESTYMQILALVQKHEALSARPAPDTAAQRTESAQQIYALCNEWLQSHDAEKESPKYKAIAALMKQAKQEAASLKQIESAGGGGASASAAGGESEGDGDEAEG